MAWTIELGRLAERELDRLDSPTACRILIFLNDRIAVLEDPRSVGQALKGAKLGDFWKYRVGDYRIICNIEDRFVRILIVMIGNRRNVYK